MLPCIIACQSKLRGAGRLLWRSDVSSLLRTLHWLPVEQRINYKLAVLTFKTQQMPYPQYLNQHISLRTSARTQHSIVIRPTAVRAISTDVIRQTILQHCRTSDLEFAATCCVKLRISLLSNPGLKLACFILLSANYSACSASAAVAA